MGPLMIRSGRAVLVLIGTMRAGADVSRARSSTRCAIGFKGVSFAGETQGMDDG